MRPATSAVIANSSQVVDPRSSSDFSALIAKKAAEKRAKFQETKPSINMVTYQADGLKNVVAQSNKSSNVQIIHIKEQSKPPIVAKPNQNVSYIIKRNNSANSSSFSLNDDEKAGISMVKNTINKINNCENSLSISTETGWLNIFKLFHLITELNTRMI